ncbi:MAG: DUF1579 domain-containing protein [Flavobacterium sp.]|uniref:DUF1579 family protein n=1 Tax=Flavobacterium sp. TaxID=239 RepID=UPI00120527DF|nr:DUF1579 family protein [Flavobacterium sp.]RZJ63354.1 MAG: DUF1579 domain-containing protein [Flavobacterium sp.]
MKKAILTFAAVALAMTACKKAEDKAIETTTTTDTIATTPTAETAEPTTPPTQEEMEKAWQEYATPGDVHKLIATDVGSWNATMKMWSDPTKEPETSQASVEIKMIFGGRYQEARYKGKVMGMDFEGVGTMGFDNASKKVVSTWYDNMGTGIMYMKGRT